MTLTVLSKIMEIIVKSYSLTRVLNRLLNFISERGSQNITVFGLYKIIIRLNLTRFNNNNNKHLYSAQTKTVLGALQ